MKKHINRELHVFDLDHTLLKGNGSYLFGKYLYQQRIITLPIALWIISRYFFHYIHLISAEKLHHLAFRGLFKGRSRQKFVSLADDFVCDNGNALLFAPAIQRMRALQQQGHVIAISSSSPDFLVQPFAALLGIAEWHASNYLVDKEGCFCVISHPVKGEDKAEYLQTLMQKYHLNRDSVTAYSDSMRDLSFLKAAGKAVAVQPERKLRTLCKHYRWEIIP